MVKNVTINLIYTIDNIKEVVYNKNLYFFDLFLNHANIIDIVPEVILFLFICYSLVTVFNDNSKSMYQYYRWLFFFSIVVICLLLQVNSLSGNLSHVLFGFAWLNSYFTISAKILITLLTLMVLLMSQNKVQTRNMLVCAIEFPLITGFSLLFIFLLISSYDFFGVYLAIEGLSLTLYTLAALLHQGVVAIEAAIKYFSLGALSTGIFLLGISLLYGLVGSLDFLEIQIFLSSDQVFENFFELKFALLCIMFGFFFKIGAFPCHIWVADVYEGIWTPVTAFFGIVIKATMFLTFLRIIFSVMFDFLFVFQHIFIFVSLGSMLIGSLGALKQVRLKRFIAYTSINQVGFLFLGIASCNLSGLVASILYLCVYVIMSMMFFIILLNTEHVITKRSLIYLSDLYYMAKYQTESAKHLSLVVLSMAGLPPLGGFIGKLFLYFSAIEARLDLLLLISMLLTVISIYYYLSLVRHIWFEKGKNIKLYFFKSNTIIISMLRGLSFILITFILMVPIVLQVITDVALSCIWPLLF